VTENDASNLKAWAGRHVELELKYETGEVERLSLDIVSDTAADFERGFLGENTPLGKAIYGRTAGSSVAYQAADRVTVRILSVTDEVKEQQGDRAAEREKKIRKAAADSDRTSAILYASSMNSKWGDYDPDKIEEDWE
jgi:hypothetical protein